MKKLYLFLLAFVALGLLASGTVWAQSYTPQSYLVRKVDGPDAQGYGSGSGYWKSIAGQGTNISNTGYLTYGYWGEGYYASAAQQIPFNFRYLNDQITTSETFNVDAAGAVFFNTSSNYASGYGEYGPGYYGYGFFYFYGYNSPSNYVSYEYDYGMYYSQTCNDAVAPFGGYWFDYADGTPPTLWWTVVGSSPNRELIVEMDNRTSYYQNYYPTGLRAAFQTVVYENAISKIQFNYGPETAGNFYNFGGGLPATVNGFTWPGSWDYGYAYTYGSYGYFYEYMGFCGMKFTGTAQNVLVDWNGNGSSAGANAFVYTYNHANYGGGSSGRTMYATSGNLPPNANGQTQYTDTYNPFPLMPDTAKYIPQSSIAFFIAYPYDLAAGTIVTPFNEEPYAKNVPFVPTVMVSNSGSSVSDSAQVNLTISEVAAGPNGTNLQVYNNTVTIKGNPTKYAVTASGSTLSGSNPYVNGQVIYFSTTGSMAGPLVVGKPYYVTNDNGTSFQVDTAQGAPPITLTSAGSGMSAYANAVPQPFGSSLVSITNTAFPTFSPPDYGIYEDTMTVFNLKPTADQNPSDNQSTDEFISSPANDIKAVAVLNPPFGARTQIGIATPISIRFRNLGTNSQTNVPLTAVVKDASGKVVFRDTVIVANWPAGPTGGNSDGTTDFSTSGQGPGKGAYYDTAFPAVATWIPATLGTDTVFGIAIMPGDGLPADDTTKSQTPILPQFDAAATGNVYPGPGQNIPFGTSWKPQALMASVGVLDLFDVPIQVIITRCSDGAKVFESDTTVPAINIDQGNTRVYFPSDWSVYHTSQIPPGCYNMCAIANLKGDINHTNDTSCSQFGILDRLKGDYYVGVGQHFQSIHAAVDSLRFRGAGGNVRLILTDANYVEDGTSDASSLSGSIDFTAGGGILGLGPNSTVTWVPKPGVSPTITFTGTRPSCFYFGDDFLGYINFEGYNPSTLPIPDKVTPEPFKRGITIVDNRTVSGPVFDFELGASNVTLKDLIIHGNGANGFYTSDTCDGVRMYNDRSQITYAQNVHDTVAIHGITVNNCEIGGTKYGIHDHGLHDEFDPVAGNWKVWRNNGNTFTRNTIGTSSNPISYAGIQFNGEIGITISHNEISNINTARAGAAGRPWNAYGIVQPDPRISSITSPMIYGDTGNDVGSWVDANRVKNITSQQGNTYGISMLQSATVYVTTGLTSIPSTLPVSTGTRITNNMLLDLYTGTGGVYPITLGTIASTYSADKDSIFNNSISTNTATANISCPFEKHVFIWNNIIQNTGSGPYTNYWLEVPRPYAQNISSDYNLFDLRGQNNFDSVIEYDARYGTTIQRLYFRRLNDWRTFVGQDLHSLTGDPLFATPAMGTDSLHMPPALSYIESPAYHNGLWLGTSTQANDFDGDKRLQGTLTPSIGADEWNGFQYTNDLAVLAILQPGGFSQTSDTSLVTTESPLWMTASVKNLSSVGVYNVPVTFTVQRSVNGLWTPFFTTTTAPMTWAVGETKNVAVQGPVLTALNDTGVFQVIVSVPADQNAANNTQTKAFRILLKQAAVLITYNGRTTAGVSNKNAAATALTNLGIPFDLLDRNAPAGLPMSTIIDYTPWWTIVWVSGNPDTAQVAGQPVGQGGLTLQETDEITRYLNAGQTYAKKDLVMAGQNIAFYNSLAYGVGGMNNNGVTDTNFLQTTMHTKFVATTPITGGGYYAGRINGQQPIYWKFSDSIYSKSPDVVKPALITPAVGPIVNGFAYSYAMHNATTNDSGAGTSYYDPKVNTVFYGFDWADPIVTTPGGNADTTSGVTRTMAGAFAFFRSHAGTILPVTFVTENAVPAGSGALVTWTVADQKDVVQYDVEKQLGTSSDESANWSKVGTVKAVSSTDYSLVDGLIDHSQTYTYRIAAVDANGAKTYSNTVELGPDNTALGYTLGASYPNPTAGATEISFTLPVASQVTIRVLDVTGKIVNTEITNAQYSAGQQTAKLDLSALPSGSYIYEITATGTDGQTATLSNKLTVEKN